ncbi:MAG: hypothetical protein Q8L15_11070 [Methylobacter sp.]|nr:hypothetical protein [Methylobacter sp.]
MDCLLFFSLAATAAGFFVADLDAATDDFLLFSCAATMACFFAVDLGVATGFFCVVCLAAVIEAFLLFVFVVTGVFLSTALDLTAVMGLFFSTGFVFFECVAVEIVLAVAGLVAGFVCV